MKIDCERNADYSPRNPTTKIIMHRRFIFLFAISASWVAISNIARADWPAKVFAPYMYIGAGDNFKLTDCDDQCGLKFYTFAFIIARQDGEDKAVTYRNG